MLRLNVILSIDFQITFNGLRNILHFVRRDFWHKQEQKVRQTLRSPGGQGSVALQLQELKRCKKFLMEHHPVVMRVGLLTVGRRELRIVGSVSALASFISIAVKIYDVAENGKF